MTILQASDPAWKKWKPCQPTSSRWYEPAHMERLIGAYITHERDHGGDRLISDFLGEFDGLSGSQKRAKVLDESRLKRSRLSEFVVGDQLDRPRIAALLAAMQRHTRVVKPGRLGMIGEDHLRARLIGMGIEKSSFRYQKKMSKDGLPWVLEAAFGWRGEDADEARHIFAGANWSAAINNPFRSFGSTGEGLEALLSDLKAGAGEPIFYVLHLAHPRIEYTDRGKSAFVVGGAAADIRKVTKAVTQKWTRQRKAEERRRRSAKSRRDVYSRRVNFSDVAAEILPAAYRHASGDGQYTVSKRQLYYAAREKFKAKTGRELDYAYFSNTLLVQYLNRHPAETVSWKITADPRGTLFIPHAAVRVPCGTLHIEHHLREAGLPVGPPYVSLPTKWPSLAAGQRYQAVLYIEKEGFEPLLKEARIAERFDLAILSCKGQSVVAARRFVDEVCRLDGGVPLFVVHDFDKAGFEISQRLTSVSDWALENDRVTYEFQHDINVTDLGLRLADVQQYGLAEEHCEFKGGFAGDSICTKDEREFLRSHRRVELNAFTSPQFIEWLETKLMQQGLDKRLIPSNDVLEAAYRRALAVAEINAVNKAARDRAIRNAEAATVPKTLQRQLRKEMKGSPDSWDKALYAIASRAIDR